MGYVPLYDQRLNPLTREGIGRYLESRAEETRREAEEMERRSHLLREEAHALLRAANAYYESGEDDNVEQG